MRDGLVEAMAEAIDPFLVHPLEAPAAGAAALDAAVEYLSEHADDVSDVMAKEVGDHWTHQARRALAGLLAVLREAGW